MKSLHIFLIIVSSISLLEGVSAANPSNTTTGSVPMTRSVPVSSVIDDPATPNSTGVWIGSLPNSSGVVSESRSIAPNTTVESAMINPKSESRTPSTNTGETNSGLIPEISTSSSGSNRAIPEGPSIPPINSTNLSGAVSEGTSIVTSLSNTDTESTKGAPSAQISQDRLSYTSESNDSWAGFFGILVPIALYLFFSYCLYFLATKLHEPSAWFAFIPVLSFILVLRMAKMSAWWIILLFVPIANLYVIIRSLHSGISTRTGHGGWWTVGLLFFSYIFLPITAFTYKQGVSLPETPLQGPVV